MFEHVMALSRIHVQPNLAADKIEFSPVGIGQVPTVSGATNRSSVAITERGVSLPVAGFSSVGTPAMVISNRVESASTLISCVLRVITGSAQISY